MLLHVVPLLLSVALSLAAPSQRANAQDSKAPSARSGFLLHAALGAGHRAQAVNVNYEDGVADTPADRTDHIRGFGLALDLGAGWGVLPGFAVGVGLFLDWVSSPTLTEEGWGDSKLSSVRLTSVGPFVDWFPMRDEVGWYLLGGFGLAVLSYRNAPDNPFGIEGNARGFSVQLGTGYELPVSKRVGLGVELRFLTSILGESKIDRTISHVFTSPSLLASLTWF